MEKARITRITVGRLYNLGNYEHVRYDLTVEIPEGGDATAAFEHLTNVMAGLSPKGQAEDYRLKEAHRIMGGPPPETDYEKQRAIDASTLIKRDTEARERRKRAKAALNEIGGAEIFKDAKESWDDEDAYGEEQD